VKDKSDMSLTLPSIPAILSWRNHPLPGEIETENQLRIIAGTNTDWFADPADGSAKTSAPVALFTPPDESFLFAAQVTVEFASTYDAGVLFVHERDDLWAKLCFEYSPQRQPTIVSVVTRDLSDDCNSAAIDANTVYLRIYRRAHIFAFHYSHDNRYWHLVRYFTLGRLDHLQIGFSAQSPAGTSCAVLFREINYRPGTLHDIRNGQ
jgi:hypothetical protein